MACLGTGARVALAALATVAAACAPDPEFDRLDYQDVSSAPDTAQLGRNQITVAQGIAVSARVSAIGDDREPLDLLELESEDPAVLGVTRGPTVGTFVFFGVEVGETNVLVISRGEQKGSVPARVAEQSGAASAGRD